MPGNISSICMTTPTLSTVKFPGIYFLNFQEEVLILHKNEDPDKFVNQGNWEF